MDNVRIAYKPRLDATTESELATLAAVYAFVLECHAKKKAAKASGGDDDGKGAKNVPAKGSIP